MITWIKEWAAPDPAVPSGIGTGSLIDGTKFRAAQHADGNLWLEIFESDAPGTPKVDKEGRQVTYVFPLQADEAQVTLPEDRAKEIVEALFGRFASREDIMPADQAKAVVAEHSYRSLASYG